MSYRFKLLSKPKLRETLFLILASVPDDEIHEKTGFSLPSIAIYKSELMFLFWETYEVNLRKIYHAAKSCPAIVELLVKEYKTKYNELVREVIEDTHLSVKTAEENGHEVPYVYAEEVKLVSI